jgi:hypothetical protein
MADENRIVFNDKIKGFKKKILPKPGTDDSTEDKEQTQTKEKDEDISLLNLTLKQDIDL